MTTYQGLIERYQAFLPVSSQTPRVTLLEGNTPLIPFHQLSKDLGVSLYGKFEGLNPTGSFKDRGMTMAISKAKELGSKAVICASTGNTSASAAAYAVRAGMKAYVLIPEGKIAMGKLAQALMHGAKVIQIEGNFDEGMAFVKQLSQELPIALVNSVNPFRLEGQKTAAFEIIDTLGEAPDFHCIPVGNAGNISAYWMGYKAYHEAKMAKQLPVMLGFQAEGAAPFIHGHPIEQPETLATAIRIGNPQSWDLAVQAQKESKGAFAAFPDEAILMAQKRLASTEGVFVEPASAISIAGAIQSVEKGLIPAKSVVVCTLTGHGLKDPDIAIKQCQEDLLAAPADYESIKSLMGDTLS